MQFLKNKSFDTVFLVLSVLVVIYLFYPAIDNNIKHIEESDLIRDDSLIYLPPFYKYLPEGLPSTYENEYLLNVLIPMGHKLIYMASAKFYDPVLFSKYLTYFLFIFTIVVVGYASYKLSGPLGSVCAILMTLSFSAGILFSHGLAGGTPRAFAYPIVALTALCLIQCRPYLLAAITIVSTLLYPLAGIISGCSMSLMLLLPSAYRKNTLKWSLTRRISFVISIAVVSGLLLLPQFLAGMEYGPRVTPDTVEFFPEAGHEGKYLPGDKIPNHFEFTWAMQFFKHAFVPNGVPFFDIDSSQKSYGMMMIVFWGFIYMAIALGLQQVVKPENDSVVRLLLLFGASLILFILAVIMQPYLYFPKRYFAFALPIFATIIFPYSLIKLLDKMKYLRDYSLSGKIAVVICLVSVLLCGGRGYKSDAAIHTLIPEERIFLDEIAKMDKKTKIAGMPYDEITAQIGFYSRKNVFFSRWQHQVLHEDNILNMRERYFSLLKAIFAEDVSDIKKIRDEYKVTHIIINQDTFSNSPPGIVPFIDFNKSIYEKQKDSALFNNNPELNDFVVLQYGKYSIYDIDKVINHYENNI